MENAPTSIIESLGVYLPPKAVPTSEIVAGCAKKIRFPLQQYSGIASRRMAGEDEFSFDLAAKAVEDCMAHSRKSPQDVELVIAANISRFDAAMEVSYEPSTAAKLQRHFGFDRALAFDLSNACAGMFTGIYVVDALIAAGLIRYGLVTSGEYITHLTATAQREIRRFMDPQMASLTLGDAGAAVLLERSASNGAGFHEIGMYTLGKYCELCIAKPSDDGHDGAAMKINPVQAARIGSKPIIMHVEEILRRAARPLSSFPHIIPHQTSRTTLREATREVGKLAGADLRDAVIDNLSERGNTASNTHVVAIKDHIQSGRIQSGDDAFLFISGSGMTVGAAVYTFDDLPDRIRGGPVRAKKLTAAAAPVDSSSAPYTFTSDAGRASVRIESLGTSLPDGPDSADTRRLAVEAAEACLAGSSYGRSEIDLLVYTGIYRSEFLTEPAAAAMAAGDLGINAERKTPDAPKTFAFDVLDGGVGWLDACYLASGLIRAGRVRNVMIAAAEFDPDPLDPASPRRDIRPAGSAVVVDRSPDGAGGFGRFVFKTLPDGIDALVTHVEWNGGKAGLVVRKAPDLEDRLVETAAEAAQQLLAAEGRTLSDVGLVLPPLVSPAFVERLGRTLGVDDGRMVDLSSEQGDLFTSSVPFALEAARERGLAQPGNLGLLVTVGAGLRVGCATYQF